MLYLFMTLYLDKKLPDISLYRLLYAFGLHRHIESLNNVTD